jgi:hypothetical protein
MYKLLLNKYTAYPWFQSERISFRGYFISNGNLYKGEEAISFLLDKLNGYVGGGLLCIFSISLLFITFFINEKHLKDLFIIYCSFNIVMFFVSGNFLTKVNWFIFVALYFSQKVATEGVSSVKAIG